MSRKLTITDITSQQTKPQLPVQAAETIAQKKILWRSEITLNITVYLESRWDYSRF